MLVSIDLEPEEPVLDGRYLRVIIDRWLEYCANRLPRHTVQGYGEKVGYFLDWWEVYGPAQGWQLCEEDFQVFANDLAKTVTQRSSAGSDTGKPLAYNTRKDVLRRLRAALRWAHEKRYISQLDIALWVPKEPTGSAPLYGVLSAEDLAKLIFAARNSPLAARNQAILAVLIGTGVRLAECAGLSTSDVVMFCDHSGTMRVQAKKVKGRDAHERDVVFDQHAGKYLDAWMAQRSPSGPLFINTSGERLTAQGIYKVVKSVAKKAGVSLRGPHDFRRTFVTNFARKRPGEGNYHLLRLQIGHAPQGTTGKHYDKRNIEDVREIFVSPLVEVEIALGSMRQGLCLRT